MIIFIAIIMTMMMIMIMTMMMIMRDSWKVKANTFVRDARLFVVVVSFRFLLIVFRFIVVWLHVAHTQCEPRPASPAPAALLCFALIKCS